MLFCTLCGAWRQLVRIPVGEVLRRGPTLRFTRNSYQNNDVTTTNTRHYYDWFTYTIKHRASCWVPGHGTKAAPPTTADGASVALPSQTSSSSTYAKNVPVQQTSQHAVHCLATVHAQLSARATLVCTDSQPNPTAPQAARHSHRILLPVPRMHVQQPQQQQLPALPSVFCVAQTQRLACHCSQQLLVSTHVKGFQPCMENALLRASRP